MSATKLAWSDGTDGAKAAPGSLIRWRDSKSHPWEYGIFQGTEGYAATFSYTPLGPVVIWRAYVPRFQEVACIAPVTPSGGES